MGDAVLTNCPDEVKEAFIKLEDMFIEISLMYRKNYVKEITFDKQKYLGMVNILNYCVKVFSTKWKEEKQTYLDFVNDLYLMKINNASIELYFDRVFECINDEKVKKQLQKCIEFSIDESLELWLTNFELLKGYDGVNTRYLHFLKTVNCINSGNDGYHFLLKYPSPL